MMKSFFKKLAFVMALAMVVSAMAPAATAKAAEKLGICFQEDTTWTAVEAYEFTEGDAAKDFKFSGAPADWKSYTWTWTSSDEKVATVNAKSGLVTPVAAGEAVVTVKGGDYEGSIKITVKAKEVVKTFEAKQVTANKVELTFADEATAKAAAATVSVTKKITTLVGTNDMPWALNDANTKVAGNKVTIEPWVQFGTATYEIAVEGLEPVTINTAVGAPAEAYLSYAKPYIFTETDNQAGAAATLKVTDAKGVELTSGYSVYYEIVTSEPSGYAYVDGTTGALSLYADPTFAVVKVTVRYTDANNQTQEFSRTVEVLSQRKPVVTVNEYLEATAVVATSKLDTAANKDKIVWGAKQVKIGDGTAQVVGLIKKSDNSSYSINNWSVGTKNETKNELASGYVFKYASTDTSKVIVDESTGTLVGVNTTAENKPAYILVTMFKPDANSATGLKEVGIVAAVPVEVQAAKAARNTVLDKTNAVLLTDGSFTEVTVTPTTYNQYDEKMADTIKEVSATFNNKTHYILKDAAAANVTIDASAVNTFFNSGAGAKAVNLTYKVTMNSGKTADFYLTLKEVTAANAANKDYKLDVKGAEIKAGKLDDAVKVSVVSKVLGEKYEMAPFYYGKVDANTNGLAVGDLYVVVLDQNKKVITPATTSTLATNNEVVTYAVTKNVADAKIETLPAGVYTVELYKVTAVINGTQGKVVLDSRIDVQSYTVTNTLPTVATDVRVDLTKTVNVDPVDGTITLNADAVKFKFNGEENNGVSAGKFTIGAVNAVTVAGSDKVFVYSFKVQYKLGIGFVEFTVPVNKTLTKQQ